MELVKLLSFSFLVFIQACSSSIDPNTFKQQNSDKLINQFNASQSFTFLFEEDREAQLNKCACELLPIGGMEKALAYIKRERENTKQIYFLSAGNAYLPGAYISLRDDVKGVNAVTNFYNQAGLDVYGVVNRDLLEGYASLKKKFDGSEFPVLSSNLQLLQGGWAFEPYHDLKIKGHNDLNFRVLALSGAEGEEIPKNLTRLDPIKAFESQQASAGKNISAWIVLGDLSAKEVKKLRSVADRVLFVFGAKSVSKDYVFSQDRNSLWSYGKDEGKAINRIDVVWIGNENSTGGLVDPFGWNDLGDAYKETYKKFKSSGLSRDRRALTYMSEISKAAEDPIALIKTKGITLY